MALQREGGIAWTDRTWNPVSGCTKVSAGCVHCYAECVFPRVYSVRKFTDVRCHEDRLEAPLHWRKPCRIFVNSMSDLFHPDVPFEFIDKVFAVMALCPQHTFQVLTKRPERMKAWADDAFTDDGGLRIARAAESMFGGMGWRDRRMSARECAEVSNKFEWGELFNVWLGVSVENQKAADERIPLLLQTPAEVRWISAEPLLGPIDFDSTHESDPVQSNFLTGIGGQRVYDGAKVALDWVVCGGESGPNARLMHPDWARSLRDQCQAAGVPFFFKQGSKANWPDYKNFDSFPTDLQIRQYPEVRRG